MVYEYRLRCSERERIHKAAHELSLGERIVHHTDQVPGFYERAKEISDQTWAREGDWQPMDLILDNYDLYVFHVVCFIPDDPLPNASQWAMRAYSPEKDENYEEYSGGWRTARNEALKAADESCERCGITQSEHRSNWDIGLHVHHIQPVRTFETPSDAHFQDNLEVLCVDCHNDAHADI